MSQICQVSEEKYNGGLIYGVVIICPDGEQYSYKYISCLRKEAERLVCRISADEISPVHFNDIVRDYLVELAYLRIEANGL